MKHARPTATLLLFILLCATLAYWGMQLFQPRPRAQAPSAKLAYNIRAAEKLLGTGTVVATASSNCQLSGIINADKQEDGVALIAVNGKPARAFRVGTEVRPGVTVKAVHEKSVTLTENGADKKLTLPQIKTLPANTRKSRRRKSKD